MAEFKRNIRKILSSSASKYMDFLQQLSTIISNVSIAAASLVAGLWAFYRFRLMREGQSNPQISLSHKVFPYTPDKVLLVITIHVANKGNSDLFPQNISLSLERLPDGLAEGETPHWKEKSTEDGKHPHLLLDHYDVIHKANPDLKMNDQYMLFPKDAYDEVVTVVVEQLGLYMVHIHYVDRDRNDFSIYAVLDVRH